MTVGLIVYLQTQIHPGRRRDLPRHYLPYAIRKQPITKKPRPIDVQQASEVKSRSPNYAREQLSCRWEEAALRENPTRYPNHHPGYQSSSSPISLEASTARPTTTHSTAEFEWFQTPPDQYAQSPQGLIEPNLGYTILTAGVALSYQTTASSPSLDIHSPTGVPPVEVLSNPYASNGFIAPNENPVPTHCCLEGHPQTSPQPGCEYIFSNPQAPYSGSRVRQLFNPFDDAFMPYTPVVNTQPRPTVEVGPDGGHWNSDSFPAYQQIENLDRHPTPAAQQVYNHLSVSTNGQPPPVMGNLALRESLAWDGPASLDDEQQFVKDEADYFQDNVKEEPSFEHDRNALVVIAPDDCIQVTIDKTQESTQINNGAYNASIQPLVRVIVDSPHRISCGIPCNEATGIAVCQDRATIQTGGSHHEMIHQMNFHDPEKPLRKEQKPRTPFHDKQRQETSQTRDIGACIRCKIQRIRVWCISLSLVPSPPVPCKGPC